MPTYVYHMLIPVLCAMAMNGFYYRNNTETPTSDIELLYLPPGYIIGIIWTILFALLGYVHFLLYRLNNKSNYASVSVVFFILFSLAYPVVQSIDEYYAYLFNVIALIVSFVVGLLVLSTSKTIFLYMIPLLGWVSYVNVVVLYNILQNVQE